MLMYSKIFNKLIILLLLLPLSARVYSQFVKTDYQWKAGFGGGLGYILASDKKVMGFVPGLSVDLGARVIKHHYVVINYIYGYGKVFDNRIDTAKIMYINTFQSINIGVKSYFGRNNKYFLEAGYLWDKYDEYNVVYSEHSPYVGGGARRFFCDYFPHANPHFGFEVMARWAFISSSKNITQAFGFTPSIFFMI